MGRLENIPLEGEMFGKQLGELGVEFCAVISRLHIGQLLLNRKQMFLFQHFPILPLAEREQLEQRSHNF